MWAHCATNFYNMLADSIKTSTLFKNFKGWGSTHEKREVFEELYRAFNSISTGSVLTYGDLLPRVETDQYFQQVKNLPYSEPDNLITHRESSYNKEVPLIKKMRVKLTAISPHCDDAFAVLVNGEQVKNIIPFDYSDTGIYNYTLETAAGKPIPFGIGDWMLDVNSAILTFNNGVPEGVTGENTPYLTFYQYVGPVGERTYIDASLFDVPSITFSDLNPVAEFTAQLAERLEEIDEGWFNRNQFNGTDLTQGVGLQYCLLTPVVDSATGDVVKGWDDNSNAQVVSQVSHKAARSNSDLVEVLFASESLTELEYSIQVEEPGITKVDLENGFVVVDAQQAGNYNIELYVANKATAVLLVRDNETQEYELYFPRGEAELTVQVPTFVDLKLLPPHLKLNSLASYSDEIIPQYYGPRVADFVVASNADTKSLRSADYIVYNKVDSFLQDAIDASENSGTHIFLRNGTYENDKAQLNLENKHLEGESKIDTLIKNAEVYLSGLTVVEGITFENCNLHITGEDSVAELRNCNLENITIEGGEALIFDSTITGRAVVDANGRCETYNTYIGNYVVEGYIFSVGSHIHNLEAFSADETSLIDTTVVDYIENFNPKIKLDASYVTKWNEDNVDRKLLPDANTIPYYTAFGNRVYAKLPDPFEYRTTKLVTLEDGSVVEEPCYEIAIKIDGDTIQLNKKGQLFTRFFTSKEIKFSSKDLIKTQAEEKGYGHADTVLEEERPDTVDDAIVDLYWSKADLVKGKLPIDQLPDSVAYGGLEYVGMWQFEDHEGKYPTFDDIDRSLISDDDYSELQKGWFFIVEASKHVNDEDGKLLDDPCYPQIAEDGVEFTAGDWVIFNGKATKKVPAGSHKETVEREVEVTVDVKLSELEDKNAADVAIEKYVEAHPELNFTKFEGELDATESLMYDTLTQAFTSNVIYTDGEKKWVVYINLGETLALGIIGIDGIAYNGTASGAILKNGDDVVYSYTSTEVVTEEVEVPDYIDTVYNSFSKLDRAYSDPVYSRLPELAPNSDGRNLAWSVDDGGTGVLRLGKTTLAEAIRLINEQLYSQFPAHPASIRKMSVVIDEEATTAELKEYIPIDGTVDLDIALQQNETKFAYDSLSGEVVVKQVGIHDELPLEHEFYCGDESVVEIMDTGHPIYTAYGSKDPDFEDPLFADATTRYVDKENTIVEVKDPYTKYNLGFKAPSPYKSMVCQGAILLNVEEEDDEGVATPLGGKYKLQHTIYYRLSDLKATAYVHEDELAELMGSSKSVTFDESYFYDMKQSKIDNSPMVGTVNAAALLASMRKIAGVPVLAGQFDVVGTFIIKDFAKYGMITKDASVKMLATLGGVEMNAEYLSVKLHLTDSFEGSYDAEVQFKITLDSSIAPWGLNDLVIDCTYQNMGIEKTERVATFGSINCIPSFPNIVNYSKKDAEGEASSSVSSYGIEFDDNYKEDINPQKTAELPVGEFGFGWYTNNWYPVSFNAYNDPVLKQVDLAGSVGYGVGGTPYRYVTYHFSLDEVRDLTGLTVKMDWGKEPKVDPFSGILEDVRLGVLVRSAEGGMDENINFMDANKAVGIFYEADFSKPSDGILYPGKSDVSNRRVTFGRRPRPVKDIYVRIGLPFGSEAFIKGVDLDTSIDC